MKLMRLGEVDYSVVPVENSIEWKVVRRDAGSSLSSDIQAVAEIVQPITAV